MRPPIALLLLAVSVVGCRDRPPLRVGTYNIRRFGFEPTDVDRLARVVMDTRSDVIALQEVMDASAVEALERRVLAVGGGRDHRALARCGGRSRTMVGFLYADGVSLARTEEYPALEAGGGDACDDGDRSGFLGVFRRGNTELHALVIHLAARAEPEKANHRRAQWSRVVTLVKRPRSQGARRVLLLGDTNSTGWMDDRNGERTFIAARAMEAGLSIATRDLACSGFWRAPSGDFEPSVLDHVLAAEGSVSPAKVHGYCARLGGAERTRRRSRRQSTRRCPTRGPGRSLEIKFSHRTHRVGGSRKT